MTTERPVSTGMAVERRGDPVDVTERVAEHIIDWLGRGLARRASVVLALSGGSTPKPLYARLAAAGLDWSRVHVAQVDERIVPADDPARNWTAIARDLVAVTGAVGHPMPVEDVDLEAAAAAYGAELASVTDHLDVVHLGLGGDGHTASLVPGDDALTATVPVAITGPYDGHRRMTLTAPMINAARGIVWQVVGAGKAAALQRLRDADPSVPAHLIRRDAVHVVADVDALPDELG